MTPDAALAPRTDVCREFRFRGNEKLEYILFNEKREGRDCWSIQAIQYKNGIKVCQATSCDVSSEEAAAREMFEKVADGFVEPFILCDVIYDLLP